MDLRQINKIYSEKSTEERLLMAWEEYGGDICMTSSFQTQSVPLLYLVAKTIPELPVIFLDTGFHFAETLAFRDQLINDYNLNVINVKTGMGHDNFKMQYGNLYEMDPDLCCHVNKTLPLQEELDKYKAWIAGVRGDQTDNRAAMDVVNVLEDGKVKICPIIDWTKKDLWTFHTRNELPSHPLFVKGFMSVGCAPCTRASNDDTDERAGRWSGNCKTECGIHTHIGKKKDQ